MSANTIAPPRTNHEHRTRHQAEATSRERKIYQEHLAPIIDHLTQDSLDQLDTLNDDAETAYQQALYDARDSGYRWYLAQGMSRQEAFDHINAETSSRAFQRRLMRDVVADHASDVEAMLPDYIGHLDPADPEYAQQVDDVREALFQVASIPRQEWEGDRDQDTDEHVRNGVYHDIMRHHTYDEHGRATGRATVAQPEPNHNAIEPVTAVPAQAPEHRLPHYDSRESVVEERYGVHVGDRMAFTQVLPNGAVLSIQYRVAGFPAQLHGEEHPPVMLDRVEQYFFNGQAISPPAFSHYAFSRDHLRHIERDVKVFQKSKGRATELTDYWETIDKRDRREKIKQDAKYVLGAAALVALKVGINLEMQRRGHDLEAARHGIAHAFSMVRDMFSSGNGEHVVGRAVDAAGNLPGQDTGGNLPALTPDQQHAMDVLMSKVHRGQGGLELYHNLGLQPDQWYGQERTLLDKFPGDFYLMKDGHVGLRHPGTRLSTDAAAYIVRTNDLLR